ncbi:hypothetical protein JKF63_03424 [Porcisia hertigi]|uniref:Uncharacterized protein n=1 Tax=Porcisia hertigi TaxID=2761500 RepID=A0A836L807_9TRYP|nr:hypothetical protein JKF63_03424 [Porcisia hertigi]
MNRSPQSPAGRRPTLASVSSHPSGASFLPAPELIEAVEQADVRLLRSLLITSPPGLCAWCDAEQNSLLHKAAALASPACLTELLQSEMRFAFLQNLWGETPLHVAARCAVTIVPILLLVAKYGCAHTVDRNGDTFLHCVLSNERISFRQLVLLMESLLERDDVSVQINTANNRGRTLFDMAYQCHSSNVVLLDLLLRYGAVSGALLLHDESATLVFTEKEERARAIEREGTMSATLHFNEQTDRARIWREERELRKVVKSERRRRRVYCDKEASVWVSLVDKERGHARRVTECRAARETWAREMQRVGRGFLARCVMRTLLLRRSEIELPAEGGTEATAATAVTLAMSSEVNARGGEYENVESEEESKGVAVVLDPTEVQFSTLPEKLLVYLQSLARTRRARRIFLGKRRLIIALQRAWRHHCARVMCRRQQAADMVITALQTYQFRKDRGTFLEQASVIHIKAMLKEVTRLITKLVWRENFCSAFREIVFMQRRRMPLPPPRLSRFRRLQLLAVKFERFVLLAQFLVSLFLLVYMGCFPRTSASQVHNSVDIALICLELVITSFLPVCWWRLWDVAVVFTALICAAAGQYGGSIVITFFTLKLPFVLRQFAPRHLGTCTLCRCVEYSTVYLLVLLPFGVAGIGATVRGTTLSHLLLTTHGNWGRVFLSLLSTVSPQYTAFLLTSKVTESVAVEELLPLRAEQHIYGLPDGGALLRLRMPLPQLIAFRTVLWLYWWSAVIVGTHHAIRHHYDISDELKLKSNKHRFRNEGKEELFDAHRAANIEALGQQLDGVMWENDVRAAKEAIEASHYDRNANIRVHRFVCEVQDTLSTQEGAILKRQLSPRSPRVAKTTTKNASKWDCRNEDPKSRGAYDVGIVETALGMVERKGFGERFIERQWTGAPLRKEMNWLVVGMLVMASVKPNLFPMEAAFSAVFAVELALSLYFLRLEFIFSHYLRLMLRMFCVVIGFVPPGIPFVVFRGLRLVEGWSLLFSISGMVRWGMVYLLALFFTMWMIAYVASLQFLAAAELHARPSICSSKTECLAVSLRELVLPVCTPKHIDPFSEAPVMAMLVLFTRFCFVPLFLTIALHPLLRLSDFIWRFFRLVVRSLHQDVLDYLEHYLEGASWYTHWGLKTEVSVDVIVRMRIWINDLRRRRMSAAWGFAQTSGIFSNMYVPQKSFIKGYERKPEEEGPALTEIICRGEFASLENNDALDRLTRHPVDQFLSRLVVRNVYVHYLNFVFTFVSIAFLWIADASLDRDDGLVVTSCVVHLLSVVVSVVVLPHDSTAVTTFVSACALLCAVVFVLIPNRRFNGYYCVRFVSLLRLGQIQVFLFRDARQMVRMYMDSALRILFPVAVMGGAAYMAELLRAQIFMVQFKPFAWMGIDWSNLTEVEALRSNVSYPEFLAAIPRSHTSRPNVKETSDLFATYFRGDAYIFYSIYSFWVLPSISVATCLSYLFWVGANLRDTNRLRVDMIPLLEDPITMSHFNWYQFLYRYVGNVVLLASLVFGCIFSPTTTATDDDFSFFFGFEVAFTIFGLVEAIMSCSFAVHRCARSRISWRSCQDDAKQPYVLYGDCVFLSCEVIQLVYYCVALTLCATLLTERGFCLISASGYATFFITARFLFLLRLLSREILLALLRNFLSIFCCCAAMLIYFVASASVLADVYAAETRTRYTPATWRAAFDAILRLAFTSAISSRYEDHWQPFNSTAVASELQNKSITRCVIEENYTTWRLAFALATIGMAILASIVGFFIGSVITPVRTAFLQPLPAKSMLLYQTLCGGLKGLVAFGVQNHDDMRPQTRRRIQSRKFTRIFMSEGIPSWAVPHLLEELDICRPVRQRRLMYALMRLLEYMPTRERRHERVREYMRVWESYRCGGPARVLFSELPVYPPAAALQTIPNPYNALPSPTMRRECYIAPLRLVQALAIFELGFPADSSVGSKLWIDFFSVVQKMRGATLLQSLWRMYREKKAFEADASRSSYERALIVHLRRGFRKQKLRSHITFLRFSSFEEAIKYEHEAFNPSSGHFDLLNRLRRHYTGLSASPGFWKNARAAEREQAV